LAVQGKSRQNRSKKGRKIGRNRVGDPRCGPAAQRYLLRNRRFENKLHRVTRCNGEAAAERYRRAYAGVVHETRRLVRIKGGKSKAA
jgi:hypothetical protein